MVPTLQCRLEAKAEILLALPLAKLEPGAPDYIDLAISLIQFEDKEVMEEVEVGANTKEDLTEMDKVAI